MSNAVNLYIMRRNNNKIIMLYKKSKKKNETKVNNCVYTIYIVWQNTRVYIYYLYIYIHTYVYKIYKGRDSSHVTMFYDKCIYVCIAFHLKPWRL